MQKPLRILSSILFLLFTVSLVSGCGQAPAPADSADLSSGTAVPDPEPPLRKTEFTLPWLPEAELNPYSEISRVNNVLFPLLYEPLFSLTPTFEAAPCLCASYSSVGAQEYTFFLRTNAVFYDGSPLTSADVAYSLEQAMASGSRYASRFSDVSNFSTPDGQTVVVALSSPNAKFPALLDIPIVKEGSTDCGRPVGTGPFLLTPKEGGFALLPRSDWWQKTKLPLASIRLFEIAGTSELLSAFQTRSVSLLTADLTGANTPGYRGDYEVRDCPSPVMLYLGCNSAAPTSVLSDPALRHALMRGVDRLVIASSLYSEHAEPAALPLSPASADYDSALADSLTYSREALRTLLDEAGWADSDGDGLLEKKDGRKTIPLQLRLLVCADSSYKSAAAAIIAEQLSNVGIEATVESCFWDRYLEALEAGSFDLYLGEVRLTADFDLRPLVSSGGALNYGGFDDAELEALMDAARRSAGEDDVSAFHVRFAELAPIIPILFKNDSLLTQRDLVTGIVPTSQNAFYNLPDWTLNQTALSE